MIELTKIRDLTLVAPANPPYLSAASGLVRIGSTLYVIADDELHLGIFPRDGKEPGRLLRMVEGALPASKADRKRLKPDFEALMVLPPHAGHPHGALCALGSGSTVNRRNGVLLALGADGGIAGTPQTVDLAPLMRPLDDAFATVNIEGAVVADNALRLFQRGNAGDPDNAIIRFALHDILAAWVTGSVAAIKPLTIERLDIGGIEGVPYCFSDAAALPGGHIVFSAVAEATWNAYDDGRCLGACIGIVDADGDLLRLARTARPHKIEGIDARLTDGGLDLLLVSDADDAAIPSALFTATMPLR